MKRILLILTICSVLTACPDKTDYNGAWSRKNSSQSPQGVRLYSPVKITPQHGTAVDTGLSDVFRIAEAEPNNYRGFMTHGSYTVAFWPRSSKCDNPAIYRQYKSANQWDGTVFDKDPRPGKVGLCFAGVMFRLNVGQGNLIGAPGMLVVDDIPTIRTVTRYEAEHNILLECDRDRYNSTIGADHVHPIMGDGPSGSFSGYHLTGEEFKDLEGFGEVKDAYVLLTK